MLSPRSAFAAGAVLALAAYFFGFKGLRENMGGIQPAPHQLDLVKGLQTLGRLSDHHAVDVCATGGV